MCPDGSPRRFQTTRWSLVLSAGDRVSPESETALSALCELYWYPVYAFVRRSGHDSEEARDLTQAFFVRLLEKEFLKSATPERGRFRSFLLGSVRHFLSDERDWRNALKRGRGAVHLPLEFDGGERRYLLEPADDVTPEHVYEQRWASGVIETAQRRFAAQHMSHGRRDLFLRLQPFLTGGESGPSTELAAELGMSAGALRVALHRLRRQYAAILRSTIAETVDRPEDVDDELRHLLDVVSRQRSA
jgi:DNA-directed RNA polymerase specialized sigma24 family protein